MYSIKPVNIPVGYYEGFIKVGSCFVKLNEEYYYHFTMDMAIKSPFPQPAKIVVQKNGIALVEILK